MPGLTTLRKGESLDQLVERLATSPTEKAQARRELLAANPHLKTPAMVKEGAPVIVPFEEPSGSVRTLSAVGMAHAAMLLKGITDMQAIAGIDTANASKLFEVTTTAPTEPPGLKEALGALLLAVPEATRGFR